jgi:hypothetical protein
MKTQPRKNQRLYPTEDGLLEIFGNLGNFWKLLETTAWDAIVFCPGLVAI